ncbi:MAG: hypothetical protein Q8Q59_15890 [Luteolibacter sp.]|nr:hypothetical protein [Luteolibacter sp.]
MKTTITKSPLKQRADSLRDASANLSPMFREIDEICTEVEISMRTSIANALRIGLRLLYLHHQTGEDDTPGGFRAALDRLAVRLPRSTAYRWLNAAAAVIAKAQGITAEDGSFDPEEITLPDPATAAWTKLEKHITDSTKGMSLRRLLIGSAATSDESRLDSLISAAESGDPNADAILDRVAKGEFTLVQAIRALGGSVTKNKERHDPVYLDIDGGTGRLTGLFPKCIITLGNTFARWDDLDESARNEAKKAWKALVINIPKELR